MGIYQIRVYLILSLLGFAEGS